MDRMGERRRPAHPIGAAAVGAVAAQPDHAQERAYYFQRLLLDPALARGGRWLLIPNLLIGLLLAGLAHRRLGVTGGRRTFWVVAALLGGLPGYLCQRFVESRRAWQPMPAVAPTPAATPVLMSPALAAVAGA